MWAQVFDLTTPVWEMIVRGTIIYLAVFALMRVAGGVSLAN